VEAYPPGSLQRCAPTEGSRGVATRDDGFDRAAVARAVRRARERFGYTQDQAAEVAGLGVVTWRQIEAGEPVRSLSLAKAERALGWSEGSLEAVGLGENPPAAVAPPGSDAGQRLDLREAADDLESAARLILRWVPRLREQRPPSSDERGTG
jgi:DNA-binding XRE family transcriptional regulator